MCHSPDVHYGTDEPQHVHPQGWNKDTLQIGNVVTIAGWRARNDPMMGNVGTIKKADGTELFTRRRFRPNSPST